MHLSTVKTQLFSTFLMIEITVELCKNSNNSLKNKDAQYILS